MNSLNITHLRLYNQQIAHTKFTSPGQLVSWFGAMQAQDYNGAKWAIGLRLPGTTDNDVEQAITDKTVVRTWPMRGTLHFVAPEDVRWMLKLMTPRIIAANASRYKQIELNDKIFHRSLELFIHALQGNKQLTRIELMNILEQAGIQTTNQRGIHILGWLAQNSYICFGPMKGKQQTFVLLDEWLPPGTNLTRDESLAEIAKRYFTSHGPATIQDFSWWTGLTIKDAKTGLNIYKSLLISKTMDGATYWMPSNIQTLPKSKLVAYLLPGFDEYIISYKDRSAILNPTIFKNKVHGMGGMFTPTIIINGQVVGTWKHTLQKKLVVVTPDFFISISKKEKLAVNAAIERYTNFLNLSVQLS